MEMTQSLIDSLDALKDKNQSISAAWNVAIERCKDIIRQHEASLGNLSHDGISQVAETLIELLPCPFCGSPASEWIGDDGDTYIGCSDRMGETCFIDPQCWYRPKKLGEKEAAYKKWNTRAPARSEIIDKIDELCITRDFEEWANLAPFMPLSKDGDGEYEDILTKRFFACFEAAYKKGMWGASRKINNNLVDEVERLQKRESSNADLAAAADRIAPLMGGGTVTKDLERASAIINWLVVKFNITQIEGQ